MGNNKGGFPSKKIFREERFKEIMSIALKNEGTCLSTEYTGAEEKIFLKCKKGHVFSKRAREIIYGEWCKKCSTQKVHSEQRIPYGVVKSLVEKRNGILLSTEDSYYNEGKINIRCDKGHTFYIRWASLNKNQWCKKCGTERAAKKLNLNIEIPRKLAKDRGGELLSDTYINCQTPLVFKCQAGHIFSAIYSSVSKEKGSWCPQCSSFGSISEKIVRLYCETILGFLCPSGSFPLLINDDGNKMRFDGFNKENNFAFEHHGTQHYKESTFYKGRGFEKRKRDDKTKERISYENGIKLLIINQLFIKTNLNQLRSQIIDFAKNNNLPITPNADTVDIDINTVYKIDPMEKLRNICKSKGGILISNIYEGIKSTIVVECKKHGIFNTKPSNLLRGNWCKFCHYERNKNGLT